jgi:hypothetical protein
MSTLKKLLSELKMGGYDIPMGKVVTAKDMPAFKTPSQLKEEEDHEVSMAQSSLDSIIRYATELKAKLGNDEKEIPAWIQDHIAKAESYIQQSANHYHEYGGESGEVANGEMHENFKKGDWVLVDNPHWKAQSGKESKQRRKVRMVVGSGSDATLFFSDGSNSSSKYATKAGKNESIDEGKNDFVATHSGTTITLKNGYKHHSEDKLNSLYDKLGKLAKGLKVKNVQLVFEEKSTKTGK